MDPLFIYSMFHLHVILTGRQTVRSADRPTDQLTNRPAHQSAHWTIRPANRAADQSANWTTYKSAIRPNISALP